MLSSLLAYTRNEDGAVTVDYVVLTAAIVAMCLVVTIPLLGGAMGWGQVIADMVAP